MIIIARFRGECTLNGLEYLLGEDGEPIQFDTMKQAKAYLWEHDATEDEMDAALFIRVGKEKSPLLEATNGRPAE